MSKAKQKYVLHEIDDMSLPTDSQCIVRILQSRGNNLHEVATPAGEQYLVSMPTKFRNYIWVKRGDYVLTDPIKEGVKVKGEITKILTKNHIKWYRAQKCWPPEFDEDSKKNDQSTNYNNTSDEDLFINTNRWQGTQKQDDSISDSDSDSDNVSNKSNVK